MPKKPSALAYFPTIIPLPDLTEWKSLIDRLTPRIAERLGDLEEARHCATVLADAWINASDITNAIQQLSAEGDFDLALRDLLMGLDEMDLELPWYEAPSLDLWRHVAGFPWHHRSDEVELLADAIARWFKSREEAIAAARLFVDLRAVARRATVDLSHRDLLAVATGRVPGGKRRVHRLLDRLWQLSREARVSLARRRRPSLLDMANEARNEYLAGRTEPLDPDKL